MPAGLANGRPSILFFHSSSCEICKSLHPDLEKMSQSVPELNILRRVLRVTLRFCATVASRSLPSCCVLFVCRVNADHNFWAPEVLNYGIEVVPCFVLLDSSGRAHARSEGPRKRESMLSCLGEHVENPAL